MPKRRIILRTLGLFLSCPLILAGILMLKNSSLIPGLITTIVAIILFASMALLNEKCPMKNEEVEAFKPYITPLLFWLVSALLMVSVIGSMSKNEGSGVADRWLVAGWLGSLLCLIIGMLALNHWRPAKWEHIKGWFGQYKQEIILVIVLLFLGGILRTIILTQHPYPWAGDEASIGIEAKNILKGEVTDLFATGWSGQPNWSFVPTAFAEAIFGKSILAVRLVSAIEGTLAILFLYLLARELFGKTVAALATGFLVAFPLHIQFSRLGVNNINDSLLVCLTLWLVLRAVRKDRLSDYLWAGIAGGLAFYTYVGSRLVLALAIFVLIYIVIRQRGYLRSHLLHLGFFAIGVIAVIAPVGYYFIRHPDNFMTRIGQSSILLNHWLTNQQQLSGKSIPAILWEQFTETTLVYISKPAISNFFNSPLPYLTIVGAVFFLFGMGYASVKILETRMMTLLVWFWAVVVFGGVLTISPPANPRLVMSTPVVAIFLALGIFKFTDYLVNLKLFTTSWQTVVSASIVVILASQNISFYFGVYRYRDYFGDANSELWQQTGLELQQLGSEYDYYLFGSPRVFATAPTTQFLAPDNDLYDITTDKIDSVTLQPGRGYLFVAIPENRADLETVASEYPGGSWETVSQQNREDILYYAYILHPE